MELQVRNARVTDVDGITALPPAERPDGAVHGAGTEVDLLRPSATGFREELPRLALHIAAAVVQR